MKKQNQSTNCLFFSKLNGLLVMTVLGLLVLAGCTSKEKTVQNPVISQASVTQSFTGDSLKYPRFMLTRQDIIDHFRLMDNQDILSKDAKFKLLILKPEFDGQFTDTVKMSLIGYPSKNHAMHGSDDTNDDTLNIALAQPSDTQYVKLPRGLIWGNIYADWKSMRSKIYDKVTKTIKTDFGYYIFTPISHEPGLSAWDGYLRYSIESFKPDGTPRDDGVAGGGKESTKPSPPAPPTY